jgi:threonine synthase
MKQSPSLPKPWPGVVTCYCSLIKLAPDAKPITLLEGNTILVPAPRLAETLGASFDWRLKYEGLNPTSSFNDRGMTAVISQVVYARAKAICLP